MAGDITITVDSAEVQRAIEKLKNWGGKKEREVEQVVNDTALAVNTGARRNLYINRSVITNRLRSSVHIENQKTQKYMYSNFHGESFEGTLGYRVPKLAAIVGTNVEYALSVERRKPFLRPAAEVQREPYKQKMIAILRK